jgi:hypothetical protein
MLNKIWTRATEALAERVDSGWSDFMVAEVDCDFVAFSLIYRRKWGKKPRKRKRKYA